MSVDNEPQLKTGNAVTFPAFFKIQSPLRPDLFCPCIPNDCELQCSLEPLIFPNEAQVRMPAGIRAISDDFGIGLYHAKTIAELQGYHLGGVV